MGLASMALNSQQMHHLIHMTLHTGYWQHTQPSEANPPRHTSVVVAANQLQRTCVVATRERSRERLCSTLTLSFGRGNGERGAHETTVLT